MPPVDVYTAITDRFTMAWPSDDDPYAQCGSANSDQQDEYDFYYDPEPDEMEVSEG